MKPLGTTTALPVRTEALSFGCLRWSFWGPFLPDVAGLRELTLESWRGIGCSAVSFAGSTECQSYAPSVVDSPGLIPDQTFGRQNRIVWLFVGHAHLEGLGPRWIELLSFWCPKWSCLG